MIRGYKDKQYLVFQFEDGKNVKYNLATGESIGKLGKPVKDVCTQLRGYDYLEIINSFQDEKYKDFLNFVDKRVNRNKRSYSNSTYYSPGSKAKNVGTFLSKIKNYSEYEQFFSSGIKYVDYPLCLSFNKIPKGLLKLCREYEFKLTSKIIQGYINHPELFDILLEDQKYLNNISISDILKLLISDDEDVYMIYRGYMKYNFMNLIKNHNYKPQSLIKYIDNLITYEALDGIENIINELHDYVRMMSSITNKFTKYPKNFLTTHKIATRNFNRMKKEYSEEVFRNIRNEDYEFSYNDYKIIYPNTTKEIKEEGVKLNHCVSSYIDRVISGQCHILFLRRKHSLNDNLVTIEVRDGKVVQARGLYNREVYDSEKEVIEKYNKKLERMVG